MDDKRQPTDKSHGFASQSKEGGDHRTPESTPGRFGPIIGPQTEHTMGARARLQQSAPPTGAAPAQTARSQKSPKSYTRAVVLCAVFGTLGIHFFYIGHILHGIFDLSLAFIALALLIGGHPWMAAGVFAIDWLHSMFMTIKLLVGGFKDGQGRPITYPGQQLAPE